MGTVSAASESVKSVRWGTSLIALGYSDMATKGGSGFFGGLFLVLHLVDRAPTMATKRCKVLPAFFAHHRPLRPRKAEAPRCAGSERRIN